MRLVPFSRVPVLQVTPARSPKPGRLRTGAPGTCWDTLALPSQGPQIRPHHAPQQVPVGTSRVWRVEAGVTGKHPTPGHHVNAGG